MNPKKKKEIKRRNKEVGLKDVGGVERRREKERRLEINAHLKKTNGDFLLKR